MAQPARRAASRRPAASPAREAAPAQRGRIERASKSDMRFSRTAALVLGVLVPLAETVRRWGTWRQSPMSLFDDYILAALVLHGAWLAGRDFHRGQRYLAAAWGVVCGVGYGSVMGQLQRLHTGEPDPAPISASAVAVIKVALLALSVAALIATLRARPAAGERAGAGARAAPPADRGEPG